MMKQLVSEIKKHFHSEKRYQSEIYRGWGPRIQDDPDIYHSSLEMKIVDNEGFEMDRSVGEGGELGERTIGRHQTS